jgi:hypothetical protein
MALPQLFSGDTECPLCSAPAKTLPNFDVYRYLECRDCGEYKITDQAEIELENYSERKYIIAGLAFENTYYSQKPFMIKSEHILNAKDISTSEKIYKLAYYIYRQTEIHGLGNKIRHIPPACCYAKNKAELFFLWDILKKLDIITFDKHFYSNDDKTVIYESPILTVPAKLEFDNGINSFDRFKEVFMKGENNPVTINVERNNGQMNTAWGNATQNIIQNSNNNLIKFQELVDDLKSVIPENIGHDEKRQIEDSIEAIKTEISTSRPNKNIIQTLLTGIKLLIRSAEFAAAVSTIWQFVENL